jgi:hypothetical protein
MNRVLLPLLIAAAVACGETDAADECVPEACTTPPPSVCLTDRGGAPTDVIVTYVEEGTCVEDRCAYQAVQATCPGECEAEFDADREPGSAECVTIAPG